MTLFRLFKKLRPFVKPYRKLVYATLILTAIGSFTAQVNAHIIKYAVDSINELMVQHQPLRNGIHILFFISAILLSKELLYAFLQFGQKFYGEKLRIYISRDLSQQIVEKILTYKLAFYSSADNESGKLQTRIDLGISSLTRLIQNFFIDILPLFANAIVALGVMFYANFWVGLVGLCIVPVYFIISQKQAKRLGGFRRKMRKYRETKSNAIISLIDSITVIKSFIREKLEGKKHEQLQIAITDNQMQTRKTNFLFDSIKGFVEQIGVVFIIVLTAYFVITGQMTIGAIMFHVLLFNNVSGPIRQLHTIYDEVNDALIYSEGFFEILESNEETEQTGNFIPDSIKGNFQIQNLSFKYPNGTEALKDVSFDIPHGETTALVGLSGAGKSTIINLLDKFYEPEKGTILLDGKSLQEYDTHELRKNIGLVLQKNHIFQGSVAENIRYGDVNANDEEITAAARKANIHEQIMDLPRQYNSDARLLSGGQQQRIAIARLFLKNPPIIFLDEPTASLDAISTEQIKTSLDAIRKDRTVVIISHSLSQIIDATNIVVLEKGHVVEKGKHEELYRARGSYYRIFNAMANSLNIDKIIDTIEARKVNNKLF
jgi:ABC-type multidrug transport system fused ATPase/permease subunit